MIDKKVTFFSELYTVYNNLLCGKVFGEYMEARIFKLVLITNVLASISVNSLTYNKVLFMTRTHYK